jgi:hypothetical protein
MSVNYKAIYGYGYHITNDMISKMDEDKYEEFIENDFTHDIDGWYDGGTGYFFGLTIKSANEGEIIEIPFKEYKHEDFMKMLDFHHYFFPNFPVPPRHYIINKVY